MTMAVSAPEPTERLQNSSWTDKARTAGGCLLYFAFSLGGLVVLVLALQGIGWIAKNIHPWTALAAEIAGLGSVPLSLLLAIFRKTRAIGAVGLLISSYVIGLGLCIWSLIIAYNFAGVVWLIIGLAFVGIGVVPVALVASAISGAWSIAGRIAGMATLVYVSRALSTFLAEREERHTSAPVGEAARAYREAVNNQMKAENTLLSACRHKFGDGYGASGLLVSAYIDVLERATVKNSHSRSRMELPSSPEEMKRTIVEVTQVALARQEEDSAIELLKMLYVSLARFLPESQALLVTQRNLGWLSEDPNHPGLRGSKEAEAVEAEVYADEDQLSRDFDRIILALLEKASAQSERTKLEKQLLDLFHELAPDDPQFVEHLLPEV
jgi:hypothetical protein